MLTRQVLLKQAQICKYLQLSFSDLCWLCATINSCMMISELDDGAIHARMFRCGYVWMRLTDAREQTHLKRRPEYNATRNPYTLDAVTRAPASAPVMPQVPARTPPIPLFIFCLHELFFTRYNRVISRCNRVITQIRYNRVSFQPRENVFTA